MTDKTPLGKLIAECELGLTRDISPSSKAYLKAFIQYATNLLPEEKQAREDAIKSEAAREYWEGQFKELLERVFTPEQIREIQEAAYDAGYYAGKEETT